MTGTYDWNPMPHRLDVRCTSCRALAGFEFAEAVRIKRKTDIPFFEASPQLDYEFFPVRGYDAAWHGALFYAGLHGGLGALTELPEGYAASDWAHSRYLMRSQPLGAGALLCAACGRRAKHRLRWPDDAWFQLAHRGQVLWAFHRESAVALRDFIASSERKIARHKWSSMLLHVPGHFLTAKARKDVLKRLERLLEG